MGEQSRVLMVLGGPGGGGVEGGEDRRPLIAEIDTLGGGHSGAALFRPGVVFAAPALPQGGLVRPGLAAAGIGADVRAGVLVPRGAVQSVAAGGHSLGLQRIRREGGRHLRRHHPGQVVLHVHLHDLAAAEHPQRPGLGRGRLLRRGHALLGRRGGRLHFGKGQGRGRLRLRLQRLGGGKPVRKEQGQQIGEQERGIGKEQSLFHGGASRISLDGGFSSEYNNNLPNLMETEAELCVRNLLSSVSM